MGAWYEQPLRPGEYDVPVMFRVTGPSLDAATETVRSITERAVSIETDRGADAMVPMYVPTALLPAVRLLAAAGPASADPNSTYAPADGRRIAYIAVPIDVRNPDAFDLSDVAGHIDGAIDRSEQACGQPDDAYALVGDVTVYDDPAKALMDAIEAGIAGVEQ